MAHENKELLLKDLCARLPYKPIVQINGCGIWNLLGIEHDDSAELRDRVIVWHGKNYPSSKNSYPIINCKPYLFPLSSMTEEQEDEWYEVFIDPLSKKLDRHTRQEYLQFQTDAKAFGIEYLLKNHFDYQGLIEKGLAIDATNLNVY